jgi:hypothetical protein
MADSKISNLTAGTVAAVDSFPFVQSGVTKVDTIQGIIDLNTNLADADQTISSASRVITLNGNTSSESLTFDKLDGTDIMQIAGDGTIGVGSAPNASNRLTVVSTGLTAGIRAQGTGTYGFYSAGAMSSCIFGDTTASNGKGVYAKAQGTSGSCVGLLAESVGVNSGTNRGIQVSASGATTNNYSLDIVAGDIKFSQASQVIELNGATSADTVAFNNGSSDILTIAGDSTIGAGIAPASNTRFSLSNSGFTNGISITGTGTFGYRLSGSTTNGCYIETTGANSGAITGIVTGATGTNTALRGTATTANTGNNYALVLNASGASGVNYAINLQSGDIALPSGATGFTGTGAYTNFTIEKGIITNAS